MRVRNDRSDGIPDVIYDLTDEEYNIYRHNGEHYEVGRQIHVDNYYYVRQFFQSFKSSDKVAAALAEKLCDITKHLDELSVVGVGSYFGHFLSEVITYVHRYRAERQWKPLPVNYCLLDNSNKKLSFLFTPELKQNLVIVLPISCTFVRCIEVQQYLKDYELIYNAKRINQSRQLKLNILNESISVFLISDQALGLNNLQSGQTLVIEELQKDPDPGDKQFLNIKRLYSYFGWDSVKDKTVRLKDTEKYKDCKVSFLVNLNSNLYLGENCPYCFPEKQMDERPLFPTKNNHDTPNLIFALPKFKNASGKIFTEDFRRTLTRHPDPGHLFGHLRLGDNSYLHYIERDRFYANNKTEIIEFFSGHIKRIIKDFDPETDRLLIICPFHRKTTTILEDLAKESVFPAGRYTLKQTNPYNEFIENFLSDNHNEILGATHIIFFDYLISNGKTFKMISDYLKAVRGEERGFLAILNVIDRTTEFSKKEILRKLSKGEDNYIAFFKLNVPLVDAIKSGNPIQERIVKLKELFKVCHLDFLKALIKEELEKAQPLNLEELKDANDLYIVQQRHRYLLKLEISHEVSNWFYDFQHSAGSEENNSRFGKEELLKLIESVILSVHSYKNINNDDVDTITDIVIKTLSQSPFNFYKDIYNTVFCYVVEKLNSIVSHIESEKHRIKSDKQIRELNFYIKRSVDLNSSFIISERFLSLLKGILRNSENNSQRVKIKISRFVRYYIDLNFKNPVRAIKLEELLNKEELLPQPIVDPSIPLNKTLADKFYKLGRHIKSENIYLIHQLKDYFLKMVFDENGELAPNVVGLDLKNLIKTKFLSVTADLTIPELRNIHAFLKRSKHPPAGNNEIISEQISDSISNMLYAIFLMKRKLHTKNFIKDIHSILAEVCSIIGPDLEYAFCIEYKELSAVDLTRNNEPKEAAHNIYSILSDSTRTDILLHKRGLIYQMLYGLREQESQNLQTFIAVTKDDQDEVSSFSDKYYAGEPELKSRDKSTNQKRVFVKTAFANDFRRDQIGVIKEDVKMALIFRLADISLESKHKHKGQAVLVITSSKEANTRNFTDFMNVEKVRLLLLIKEELLSYLRKQFENDAFIGLLDSRKEIDFKNSMEHMLTGYFNAMSATLDKPGELTSGDKIVLNFLQKKVYRHIQSISADHHPGGGTFEIAPQKYSGAELKELFDVIMKVPELSQFDIGAYQLIINEEKSFDCPHVIFEQVIPELIINMRRNSCYVEMEPHIFKIDIQESCIAFTNHFNVDFNEHPRKIKEKGGKKMCLDILRELSFPAMEEEQENDLFIITLPIKQTQLHESINY